MTRVEVMDERRGRDEGLRGRYSSGSARGSAIN